MRRITVAIAQDLRFVPLVTGFIALLFANRLYEVDQAVARGEVIAAFHPGWWAWWMLVTGALCITYAFDMTSRVLLTASGVGIIVGFASRAVAALYSIYNDTSALLNVQIHAIGVRDTLAAFFAAVIWTKLLRPATGLLINTGADPEAV